MCTLAEKYICSNKKQEKGASLLFYEPLSRLQCNIKACDCKEAANSQESLAILNWFQKIYQRGCLQLPISRDGVLLHRLDMC